MSDIRDFLQGASNAAASNVSAPIDAIAWALRKAGLNVPQNALLGSQWMAEQGLTLQPTNAFAGLLGESFGGVAPIVAAAKAPQIANALLRGGENIRAPATMNPQMGAVVYHGSPHKFDAFDSSKIGTGEGAQAYGHGMYLADAPDVARTYSADRAYVGAAMQGKPAAINYDDPAWIAQKTIDEFGDPVKAKARLEMVSRTAAKHMTPEAAAGVQGAIDLVSSGAVGPKGNLYKVDIPDEKIARMLDWDKPLSQQAPEVQSAIQALGVADEATRAQYIGRGIYDSLAGKSIDAFKNSGKSVKAARRLQQAGIPGIRYLDGGSRGAGAGTSNYVVFPGEENALKILERNGMPIR